MKRYRVWHIPNVPGKPYLVFCTDYAQAQRVRDLIADYDLFLGDLIVSNAQGIERYEDGEWSEWDEWEEEARVALEKAGAA